MSKKTKTTKEQGTSSTTFDPTVTNAALGNYNDTKQLGADLTAYTGDRVAGFNPAQTDAQGFLTQIGHGTSAGLNSAAGTAQGLSQFVAPTVSATSYNPTSAGASQVNRGAVRDVTAGQLKDTDLSAYSNPYTQQVIDTSLADQELFRQRALVADRQRAQGSGAYNGSRSGILEGQTNEAAIRAAGSLSAQLHAQGYDAAVAGATGDINRRFGADQSNQGVDYNVASTNASLAQQAALANAAAANQAGQFNASTAFDASRTNAGNAIAGAGVQQGGAGLLAGLSQQQLQDQLTRAGALSSVGDVQGAHSQAALDAAYAEFVRVQQAKLAAAGLSTSALGAIPKGATTNTTGNTQVQDPLAGLTSLGQIAMGAAVFA